MARATFGGGCFWCLEAVFERLNGVSHVVSGYAGGVMEHPDYASVCTGTTGHAEVVQITFDPEVIGYGALLEVFFAFHDPTTPDRQGPDVGPQYRSVILTESEAQRSEALAMIERLESAAVFEAPIVTEVLPLERFWPGEPEHQRYFSRHPERAYCAAVIAPKVAKLRASWAARLKPEPR